MEKNIELIKLHNKLKNSLLASWSLFLEIDKIIHDIEYGKKQDKTEFILRCGSCLLEGNISQFEQKNTSVNKDLIKHEFICPKCGGSDVVFFDKTLREFDNYFKKY